MKKFLYIFTCCMLILCCGFMFMGCDIIQGKSAYDIAVENGFKGTVDEWLESLKGADGDDGEHGKAGKDGKDVSIKEIFDLAVEYGLYTDDASGYSKFLSDYFVNNLDLTVDKISEAANKALNSAVSIYCEDSKGNLQCGAGVFYEIDTVNKYAYVITNYHVISYYDIVELDDGYDYEYYESSTICLYLYGTESLQTDDYGNLLTYGTNAIMAEYIGGSANYDLAVLKVSGKNFEKVENSSAKAVVVSDSDNISLCSAVIAIGNPMGGGTSVCEGIISTDSEYITIRIAGTTRILRCMRITAPINSGNSGGGLFNINGELVGICNAKKIEYVSMDASGNLVVESYENVAYALPSTNVKNVVENIIDFYEINYDSQVEDNTSGVHKYLIGITITSENTRRFYDENKNTHVLCEDIIITKVNSDSVAQKIGLTAGDIISSMVVSNETDDDEEFIFRRRFQLLDAMLTLRVGDNVVLNVLRTNGQGQSEEISVSFEVISDGFAVYKGAEV